MKIFNNLKSSLKDINGATYINGVKIDGAQSIIIENGKVYVNGNLQGDLSTLSIEIKVEGNVGSINTTSGDVTINGDANSINTASGDVDCHEVKGSVHTMSGDVTCGDIAGSVSTISGDVYQK